LLVQPGDEVNVGTSLFFNKYNPRVKFSSPVSGTVREIVRGERRMILELIIEPKDEDTFLEYKLRDLKLMSREEVIEILLESGMWPTIRQRPFSIIANPDHTPKAIFISGFDSAPLAPDLDFIMKDFKDEFQKGIDVLSKLTEGKVHLGLNATYPPCKTYSEAKNIEIHKFKGPHPAGNVGIQIHHIDPINKGDIVWYLAPHDIVSIGNLFINGKIDNNLYLALTGSEVKKPVYYKMIRGSAVSPILEDNLENGELRVISGNVLTGTKISKNGFIGFYDNQITVIPEGNYYEFVGWATPGFGKFSVSRTFFSWLTPKKEYTIDTNLKGGKRAFVMTGEYTKVLPMDIYPVQLLKSILVDDIDQMEKLGIYEVAEEDFALCEFVCTSKTNVQEILRQGLDLMRKETE
jgi:Na+-transporting NADH:ubiquinone oxidoreductase subunit A